MLRHRLVLVVLLLGSCAEEAPVDPAATPAVDRAVRPAAPLVETGVARRRGTKKTKDQLLRALPADALLCAHVPDLARAWSKLNDTVYGTLIRGMDLLALTIKLRPAYERMAGAKAKPGVIAAPAWSDVERVIRSLDGEVMLSLLDLSGFDAREPDIRALAGVSVHGAGLEARRLVDFLVGMAGQQPGFLVERQVNVWSIRKSNSPYSFEIGVDHDVILFGLGEDTVAPALRRLRNQKQAFAMASQRLFKPDDVARFHLNVARLFARYTDELPTDVLGALRAVRLDRVRGLSGAVRIDEERFAVSTYYDSPGGYDMYTRYLVENPVDFSLLEQIPANLASFSLFTFNPAWILRQLRTGLPPEQGAALRLALGKLEESGFDLSGKTLSHFGPQCAQIRLNYEAKTTTGPAVVLASLANSAWLIKIKSPDVVNRFIDRITKLIPARRRYRIGRDEAVTFDLGLPRATDFDVAPSIAVTNDCLYLALSEPSLRKALERGDSQSAKDHRARLIGVPNVVSSVTYDDMKSPGLFGTAILTAMNRAGAGSARDPVIANRVNQLAAAMHHLQPTVAYTSADEAGVFTHTLSPTMGMGGLGGVTGIAIIAAIAIPSLLKARTAANESGAIRVLSEIRNAQEQYRIEALSDRDHDNLGEYGYMRDLMHPQTGDPLIEEFPGAGGRYLRYGYFFRVFLPGASGKPIGDGDKASNEIQANFAEKFVVVAAWPVEKGKSGRRAFVLNSEGQIFFCADGPYGGRRQPPADILCFEPGNMASRVLRNGAMARDGQRWYRVR